MELSEYTGVLRGELGAITRFASEDVSRAGQMLAEALDSSVRLTLLDVLSAAAAEITAHLDDTVVEVRLAGGEPSFMVMQAQPEAPAEAAEADSADETGTARITLRLSDALKVRVEAAAAGEGLSVNGWLVHAAIRALDGPGPTAAPPRSRRGVGQRITGYARS
jgi:hypothetical protein